jgi:hypothetical protein
MVNPSPGTHVLLPPAGPGLWCTPAEMVLNGGTSVTARDYPLCADTNGVLQRTRHDSAPHIDDIVPSTPWAFDITCPFPAGFGAAETRVKGYRAHPGAGHADQYEAVVGAIRGTAPGPSLAPRTVIIHGSIGKHLDTQPGPNNPPPSGGGASLHPPSRQPTLVNQDYPSGQIIAVMDPIPTEMVMLSLFDCVSAGQLGSVLVRHGSNGPVLMDLRPLMQTHVLNSNSVALTLQNVALPTPVIQAITSGNAYIEVQTSAHQDGKLVGALTMDSSSTVSIHSEGTNVTVAVDGPGILQSAEQLGSSLATTRWTRFSNMNPLVETADAGQRFYCATTIAGWDFDGDGQDDLVRTPDGVGYDVGGGQFVEILAGNWMIVPKPGGFDVMVINGAGVIVKTYHLRDLNGDGDFSEAGEVTTTP